MYTMQDPDTASQELAKWQETYATSGNGKEETRETVKHSQRRRKTEETDST